MKITKVNIPKSFNDNGIEEIKMDRLGKVVLVAGKNGSGKTRLLKKIELALNNKPTLDSLEQAKFNIPTYEQTLASYKQTLTAHESQRESNPTIVNNARADEYLMQVNRTIQQTTASLLSSKSIVEWNLLETDELNEQNTCVPFVPKTLELHDSNNLVKGQLKGYADNVNNVGIQSLPYGAFAKIQYVQERWFNATHQNSTINEQEKREAIEDYERLKQLIEIFLNTTIERDLDGNATLFGFVLGNTNLSDGQKILLQFCVAIYSQNVNLKDLILIMDEPENHLHPSVIVETIDRISKFVNNGQIWIATHSIPLLAHFGSDPIWYMDKGAVSFAGNIPEKVLESLLGDEHEIAKLQDFIGLPAQLALNRFAYECLFEPEAVITGKSDPQVLQIRSQLGKFEKEDKIKILDYGAGKGRLLANIIEDLDDNIQSFADRFEYVAFDKFDSDKKECEELLAKTYGSSVDRYFNDYRALLAKHDKASFDIVIMSNVFHEIEPKEWLSLFSNDGHITELIADNGVLILVEDMQIPVGEKAYQNGFIVLDTPQLRDLFNMRQEDFVYIDDARHDGRLKCHVIHKQSLKGINKDSRISALKSLNKIAKDEIVKIRNAEKNYKNGKLHGFWVQQLANTTLALSELTNE